MKFFAVSLLGGLRRRGRRLVGVAPDHAPRAHAVAPRTDRRGSLRRRRPQADRRDEISHLAGRFREMATRLAEAEELERNFLMSVSHELRTPLTAIRGHLEAVREGVVAEPEAQAESLDVIAAETDRLERLVGDVLDLAKLDARRFTCCARRSTWGACSTRPTRRSARRRGARHRLPLPGERAARDHDRRRPRAPDHLQPPRQRFAGLPTAARSSWL